MMQDSEELNRNDKEIVASTVDPEEEEIDLIDPESSSEVEEEVEDLEKPLAIRKIEHRIDKVKPVFDDDQQVLYQGRFAHLIPELGEQASWHKRKGTFDLVLFNTQVEWLTGYSKEIGGLGVRLPQRKHVAEVIAGAMSPLGYLMIVSDESSHALWRGVFEAHEIYPVSQTIWLRDGKIDASSSSRRLSFIQTFRRKDVFRARPLREREAHHRLGTAVPTHLLSFPDESHPKLGHFLPMQLVRQWLMPELTGKGPVLDCCSGLGHVLMAAREIKRQAVGFERLVPLVKHAHTRLRQIPLPF